MKIHLTHRNKLARRLAGYVWLLCLGVGGVVVFTGITVYVLVKACKNVPPPGPIEMRQSAKDYDEQPSIDVRLVNVPNEGQGFIRAAIFSYDGSNTFILKILRHENLMGAGEHVYWITGTVDKATGNAQVKAYENNTLIDSNQWNRLP